MKEIKEKRNEKSKRGKGRNSDKKPDALKDANSWKCCQREETHYSLKTQQTRTFYTKLPNKKRQHLKSNYMYCKRNRYLSKII